MDKKASIPMSPSTAVFLTYKDVQGTCWPLIASAIPLASVAVAGMAMNAGVIWTTVRHKSVLNGTANFLLALCSFFELLHQHGHLLFLWTALSTNHFLEFQLVVHICTVSLFGLASIPLVVAFTGLDRLLAVLFPIWTQMWLKPVPYLCAITLCCVLYSIHLVAIFYATSAQMPQMMITGTIGDMFQGEALYRYSSYTMVLNLITIALYLAVGVAIGCRKAATGLDANATAQFQRRIFRSLLYICLFNVGGYLIGMCWLMTAPLLFESPLAQWFSTVPLGVIGNMSAASNGPILYATSKEYRKAFRTEFRCAKTFLARSPANVPTQSSVAMAANVPTQSSVAMAQMKWAKQTTAMIGQTNVAVARA